MFSYRAEASALLLGSTAVDLSAGTTSSTSASTSVRFNTTLGFFAAATGISVESGDLFDVRVATLGTNIYEYALLATAGTAASDASRADQQGAENGVLLLRSELTMVEVASQDEVSPLSVTGLGPGELSIKLVATHPFNTSFEAFERSFACKTDKEVRSPPTY